MSESFRTASTVETVLLQLAAESATGCLVVRDPEGDEAQVYLREGGIYAVTVPGRRAMLGVRLVSSGALTPEALSEALRIQRTELESWRLGELLIHLGYVEPAVVEASVVDHMTDALADLVGRPMAAWRFRKRKKTRQDTGPRTPVQTLFDDLRDRARAWDSILETIGGTDAAPTLAPGDKDATQLEPNERALLRKVDGRHSVADLAGECGLTLFEGGQVLVRLLAAGYVVIDMPERHAARLMPGGIERATADEHLETEAGERALWAEAERRALEDRERSDAERRAEAVRKAEAKDRAEAERRRVATEQRRAEAKQAEAAELQRLAARRKEEQAERIRAAAAERDARAARQRQLIEAKRLEDAEILHRELEALAAKEAAERAAAVKADREAAEAAVRARTKGAQQKAAADSARRASELEANRVAQAAARVAQEAAEKSVGEEAERIAREDAERRTRAAAPAPVSSGAAEDDDQRAVQGSLISASNLLTQLSQEVGELKPAGHAQAQQMKAVPGPDDASGPAEPPGRGQADTAMLLRELSSLNFGSDDFPPAGAGGEPPHRPPPRAVSPLPVDNKAKKRKGLFGR